MMRDRRDPQAAERRAKQGNRNRIRRRKRPLSVSSRSRRSTASPLSTWRNPSCARKGLRTCTTGSTPRGTGVQVGRPHEPSSPLRWGPRGPGWPGSGGSRRVRPQNHDGLRNGAPGRGADLRCDFATSPDAPHPFAPNAWVYRVGVTPKDRRWWPTPKSGSIGRK